MSLTSLHRAEYNSWSAMLHRCYNTKLVPYREYGGRGITVCAEWQGPTGFSTFISDMGSRPSKAHTLDRIDNDKGYSKDNCRWVTKDVQSSNMRHGLGQSFNAKFTLLKCNGEWKSYLDWVNASTQPKMTVRLLRQRITAGWPAEEALGFKPHTTVRRESFTSSQNHAAPVMASSTRLSGRFLTYNGLTASLDVWSHIYDIDPDELYERSLKLAWTSAEVLGLEARQGWTILDGKPFRTAELAKMHSVSRDTVSLRQRQGATAEQALGLKPFYRDKKVNGKSPSMTHDGITKPIASFANQYGVSPTNIRRLLAAGADSYQALGLKPFNAKEVREFNKKVKAIVKKNGGIST